MTRRREIGLGLAAIVGALMMAPEAINAIRTGSTIRVLNEPAIDGYSALAAVVWLASMGLVMILKKSRVQGSRDER